MKNSLKTFLITIIGISILFSGFSFSRPKFYPIEAKAAMPVSDVLGAAIEKIWKVTRKAIFHTLKRRILQALVDQTVAWIQGGGKPQFITEWKVFANTALKQGIGDAIIDDPTLSFLCSPFRAQLKFTLPLVPIPKFSEEARCTLDDIGLNLKNFGEDFRAGIRGGSWIGFHNIWEPQNNFFGAQIIGQYRIFSEQERTKNTQLLKGLSGGGFLGMEKSGKITTPGSITGAYVAEALGTDFNFIVNAQEAGEIVAALTDAAFNRLMKEGTKGLAEAVIRSKEVRDNYIRQINADFERVTKTDLQTIYLHYTTQINQSLLPRQEAGKIIEKTINDAKAFLETNLEAKYAELKADPKRICLGEAAKEKENFIYEASHIINTTFDPKLLPNLEKNKEENNKYLELLSPAKKEIEAINAGRLEGRVLLNADGIPLTNLDKMALMGEKFTDLENKAQEKGLEEIIFDKDEAQRVLNSAEATYQNTTAEIKEATKRIENLCPIVIPAS